MYLRLVYYILRITIAPVHDSVSIAPGLNAHLGVYVYISSHVSSPQTRTGGIYVVVVAIITGNAPGKGLSLYGVVYPHSVTKSSLTQVHTYLGLPTKNPVQVPKYPFTTCLHTHVAYAHMYM